MPSHLVSRRLVRARTVLGHPGSDAVLVEDGCIRAIGTAESLGGSGADLIDHGQGVLTPALHDHHFHPVGYASAVSGLTLKNSVDHADLLARLRVAADRLAPNEALVGNRLDEERMTERRLPTRFDLDRAVGDRPTLLYRCCGHVAVANTAALQLAGLDPEGVGADGILREDAIQPVSKALSGLQPVLKPGEVSRAIAGLGSLGLRRITAIVSAGEPLWCGVADEIGTLLSAASGNPIDIETLVIASTPGQLEAAAARLSGGASNISFLGWKDFADGSLGGRTAALHEPYSDDPDTAGVLRLDPGHARLMAEACIGLGGKVAIHAIGDLANDRVLDLFEGLISHGAAPDALRIEHASVLSAGAIGRMADLGITASVQPAFIASESGWLGHRLGPRVDRTYRLEALWAAGITMVGGSDCPVESPNPWEGISAAAGPGGLGPEPAFALFGRRLTPGDDATFLVVDRDPTTSAEIASTRVLASYRSGEPLSLVEAMPFA